VEGRGVEGRAVSIGREGYVPGGVWHLDDCLSYYTRTYADRRLCVRELS
jgi:hypothetical protein